MFNITEINDGAKLRFEMRNESGELESSFTFNPYDLYFHKKLSEVTSFLKMIQERKVNTREEWIAFNEALAYTVSEAVGGNQEGCLFRVYNPMEQLADGSVIAVAILTAAAKAQEEYMTERKARFASRSFHYEKK